MTAIEAATKMIQEKGYLVIAVSPTSPATFSIGDHTTEWAQATLPQPIVIIGPASQKDWHEQERIIGIRCKESARGAQFFKAVTD